jgi:hypothetical protein
MRLPAPSTTSLCESTRRLVEPRNVLGSTEGRGSKGVRMLLSTIVEIQRQLPALLEKFGDFGDVALADASFTEGEHCFTSRPSNPRKILRVSVGDLSNVGYTWTFTGNGELLRVDSTQHPRRLWLNPDFYGYDDV